MSDDAFLAAASFAITPIRVGVEHVGHSTDIAHTLASELARSITQRPGNDSSISPVLLDALPPRATDPETPRVPGTFEMQIQTAWTFDRGSIAMVEDLGERFALRFVHELMGEDRRRLQRELATPLLLGRMHHRVDFLLEHDRREMEAESELLSEIGPGMLDRPFRSLIQEFDVVRDFEHAFQDFKANHVPLSDAWAQRNGRGRDLGHVSFRVRMSPNDPMRVSWTNSNWRVATGMRHGTIQYRWRLRNRLEAGAQVEHNWSNTDTRYRAELIIHHSATTRSYLAVSDSVDFLGGPTRWLGVESPFDGEPGILFYFEHEF